MARLKGLLPALLLTGASTMLAADSVRFLSDKKLFVIDAGPVTLVSGINERGELQHVYWGGRLTSDADLVPAHIVREWASFDLTTTTTPQEYPGQGAGLFTEPCLKITMPDGNRDLVLHYASHKIAENALTITLRDIHSDVFVDLSYTAYAESGIIRKSAVIRNGTKQPLVIESAQAGVWYVPWGSGYHLSYLNGRWAGETQLQREPVNPGGIKVLESRRGSTSQQANPWFALDRDAGEESGRVWFGALGWSGSWRISVEDTPVHQVRVTGGFNPFDFGYRLQPGESLETPGFYAGYTDGGFGAASRILHRFELEQILPQRSRSHPRPVLYNSWEATTFNVNEAGQRALAEKAAKIGVERFVMDDGWFGARDNDRAGLGDWVVNPRKFPNGLKPLIDRVHQLGMDFGLWVEPEMVNPDSDLYRAHPDWVYHFAGRSRSLQRNQLVLNLARPDVAEWMFTTLDRLLSENKIEFIKWDMNRSFSEPGWPARAGDNPERAWTDYTHNLYTVFDALRAAHPGVDFESCASGGGRVDLGILRRVEQVWPSDNTDGWDRVKIQEGFTQAYPPQAMMAWVTDSPNFLTKRQLPLSFRFHVAMAGALGVGGDLHHWTDAELTEAAELIATYKEIRPVVQRGRLYRLASVLRGPFAASQYVAGHDVVVFAWWGPQPSGARPPRVRLAGLDPAARYRETGSGQEHWGAALLADGLPLPEETKYTFGSTLIRLVCD